MASPLQNRIVGTVILAALAVIFLPDLLDGNKVQRDDELEQIPLRPQLTMQPQRAEFPEDIEQRVAIPDEFDAPPEPREAQTEEVVDAPAWVIRLGAFRNTENVAKLVSELQEAGFSAYSRPARSQNGELSVLLVGPDLDADRLQAQLGELHELTGLEGQIVRYQASPE